MLRRCKEVFESLIKRISSEVFKISIPENSWESFFQFIKFGIVGLSNTLVGYIIYAITLRALRCRQLWPSIDIYIAQFVMFLISVAWSFFWNERMVFKKKNGEQRSIIGGLVKTYISYGFTNLFLSEILLALWVGTIGMNAYVAPIINLAITVPLNFVLQKYWTFGKGE